MNQGISQHRKIFLIGFMGSGKTHWGRIWSKQSGIPFSDLDEVIEKQEGNSVSEIFEVQGEKYFRDIERRQLHQFSNKESFILSCGGGTPCFSDNLEFINRTGISIYLKCEPTILLKRLITERTTRPLITDLTDNQLYDFIVNKVKEREQYYLQASIILDESKAIDFNFNSETCIKDF